MENSKAVKLLEYLSSTVFFVMIVLVLYQVFMRKVLNASPPWTEELARYGVIWSTLLMAPVLIMKNGHIYLDYFVDLCPPVIKKVVQLITGLVTIIITLFFLSGGFGMIQTSMQITQNSPGAQLPMWIVYIILPLSGILMLLAQIWVMFEIIRSKPENRPVEE